MKKWSRKILGTLLANLKFTYPALLTINVFENAEIKWRLPETAII